VRWKRISIVGVGLLGGSLGMALKQRRLAECVIGYVRRAASVAECKRLGAVDHATRDLHQAVANSDLIILCTPIGQMRPLLKDMLPAIKAGAVITDVGSVKSNVVGDLEGIAVKAGAHFIGSHPMAGGEKTGVTAARPDLFGGAVCVVTTTPNSNRKALSNVESLWRGVGAKLLRLSPATHDKLVSRSSHLPHVVAAELANLVLSVNHPKEQALLCANGFRDTTRIALSSPEMWRDIALANRENLVESLDSFIEGLHTFRRSLAKRDGRAISEFFQRAKERRAKWNSKAGAISFE
jgi:prephenate dehydrogenase